MSLAYEELRVVVTDRRHRIRVHIEGDLDCASAPHLRDVCEAAFVSQLGDVDVDMSKTTFCGVAGLTALLAAERQLRLAGRQLRIVHASRPVLRLLDLTGTRRLVGSLRPGDPARAPTGLAADLEREAGTS